MFLSVEGKKVNYIIEGTGPTKIAFIHGWGGTLQSLKPLHDQAKGQYTSLVLDLPGFGQSDNPNETWGVDEYADFLQKTLRALNFNPTIYFGHSFGGGLGIYLAAKYPNFVTKLILCAPAFKRNWTSYKEIKNPLYKKVKRLLWPIRRVYYKYRYPKSEALLFPHLEENFAKILTQDLTDLLIQVKQPTLVLWGDKDSYTPIQNLEILKQQMPTARIITFANIGHSLPIREPDKVYQEIHKFLAEEQT